MDSSLESDRISGGLGNVASFTWGMAMAHWLGDAAFKSYDTEASKKLCKKNPDFTVCKNLDHLHQ